MLYLAVLIVTALVSLSDTIIIGTSRSRDIQECYDQRASKTDITKSVGACIHWKCMQMHIWQLLEHKSLNITITDRQWIEGITSMPIMAAGKKKRQAQTLRVRREYRRMTTQQRNDYHRAINRLKEIRIGNMSRYDFIANIHTGDAIPLAHDGPNFLGFHRVYLLIYENALREVVPGVSVPYFASSMDNEMPRNEQTLSAIWTDTFLGNGDGFVTNGPFANWNTPSGPLVRNIGVIGSLYSNENIGNIMAMNRTANITEPNAPFSRNIEAQHDAAHMWISGMSGQMGDLNTAAQDPVFFNHHAFVDYIWEEFRSRQLERRIDPSTDFPTDVGNSVMHAPNNPMRFGNLRNIDGYSNYFTTNIYRYEMAPTCTTTRGCMSDYLTCERSGGIPRCVALRADQITSSTPNVRVKRAGHHVQTVSTKLSVCSSMNYRRAIQNSYVCNEHPDIREWGYIPVDIVYRRPPEVDLYGSFPVFNGKAMKRSDIYSPVSYIGLGKSLPTGQPARFSGCDAMNNAGKVFIHTTGMNYYGSYTEFAVVDNRLSVSRSTGYAGIKSPEGGTSEVLVTVHDACGRICKPYCKYEKAGTSSFRPCSGAVRVTSDAPKMYGRTYGETVLDTWQFPTNGDCPDPESGQNLVFLRYYCDFSNDWPFVNTIAWPVDSPNIELPRTLPSVSQPGPSLMSSVVMDSGATAVQGCLLGHGCVVRAICGPCTHGHRIACLKSRTMFAACSGDKYVIRRCIRSSQFDTASRSCKTRHILSSLK